MKKEFSVRNPDPESEGDGSRLLAVGSAGKAVSAVAGALGPGAVRPLVLSDDQLRLMLAQARGAEGLNDLRKLITVSQAFAKQCELKFSELHRLAASRLQVERALGAELSQTVSRGGCGSKLQRATSKVGGASNGLPEGISKYDAKRYRALAEVTDAVFAEYLAETKVKRKIPSAAGARRAAAPARRPRRPRESRRQRGQRKGMPAILVDALQRFMTPDWRIGTNEVEASHAATPASVDWSQLSGDVLIVDAHSCEIWIPKLEELRRAAQVRQAVVILEPEVWADWFGAMSDEWSYCFLSRTRCPAARSMVAHLGEHAAAFHAAFGQIGRVLTPS